MSTLNPKHVEIIDKENTMVGVAPYKKDKTTEDTQMIKKTVLGEANQQIRVVEEPSSP